SAARVAARAFPSLAVPRSISPQVLRDMPSACPTWARLSPACARKSKRVECSPLLGTTVSGSASRTFMALTKFSGVGLATPFSHLEIAPRESLAAIARSVMLMPDFRRSFLKAVGLKSDNDIRGILIVQGSNMGRFFLGQLPGIRVARGKCPAIEAGLRWRRRGI